MQPNDLASPPVTFRYPVKEFQEIATTLASRNCDACGPFYLEVVEMSLGKLNQTYPHQARKLFNGISYPPKNCIGCRQTIENLVKSEELFPLMNPLPFGFNRFSIPNSTSATRLDFRTKIIKHLYEVISKFNFESNYKALESEFLRFHFLLCQLNEKDAEYQGKVDYAKLTAAGAVLGGMIYWSGFGIFSSVGSIPTPAFIVSTANSYVTRSDLESLTYVALTDFFEYAYDIASSSVLGTARNSLSKKINKPSCQWGYAKISLKDKKEFFPMEFNFKEKDCIDINTLWRLSLWLREKLEEGSLTVDQALTIVKTPTLPGKPPFIHGGNMLYLLLPTILYIAETYSKDPTKEYLIADLNKLKDYVANTDHY